MKKNFWNKKPVVTVEKTDEEPVEPTEKPVRVQFEKDVTAKDILAGIHELQDEWAKQHPERAHRKFPTVYDAEGNRIPK